MLPWEKSKKKEKKNVDEHGSNDHSENYLFGKKLEFAKLKLRAYQVGHTTN